MALPKITDLLHDDPDCPYCLGDGLVCEQHPSQAWGDSEHDCGAPGMPCVRSPKLARQWHDLARNAFELFGEERLAIPEGPPSL